MTEMKGVWLKSRNAKDNLELILINLILEKHLYDSKYVGEENVNFH